MPKNRDILLLIVVASVLLAGCQLTGSRDKGAIPDSSSAFEGKEGLVLSFFDNAPQDNLIPGSDFKIAVLLENKGAADIACDKTPGSCGYYLAFAKEPISGVTPSSGELKDALLEDPKVKEQYTILGKESYLSGGRAAMEFSDKATAVKATTTASATFIACYPYKTSLSASVCVQTAHYTVPEKSRSCELKTLSFSNQGAPVAITKIEQESILSGGYVKPRLKVYISEAGRGTVIAKDVQSLKKACTKDPTNLNDIIGKVIVEEATISGKPLDCGKKTITLTGVPKKDFVECLFNDNVFEAGAANNLVAPLKIVLGYGYQTAISKDVRIEVLDTLPKIKRFSIAPAQPKPGETLNIFTLAEDDTGLKEIQLLDKDGKLISSHPCSGGVSCSNTSTEKAPAKAGETFTYKAMAIDMAGKPSDISMASGTVGGIIVTITLSAEAAPAGTEVTITASATSTFTKLKTLELLYSGGTAVGLPYDCKSKNSCTATFKRQAPAKGSTDAYYIRATDTGGATAESEKKPLKGT